MVSIAAGEKIIKVIALHNMRNDIYLAFLSRFGQIKRMSLSGIETMKRSRPARCMKLLNGDEVVGIQILSGNSDLLVLTSNGMASLFNENELTILGPKAGGVKSISGLGKNQAVSLIAVDEGERAKAAIITDKGHERVIDINKLPRTARLGKPQEVCPSFKGDPHKVVAAIKVSKDLDLIKLNLHLNDNSVFPLTIDDFRQTDARYAKANIGLPSKTAVNYLFDTTLERIDKRTVSRPIVQKEPIAPVIKEEIPVSEPDDTPIPELVPEEPVEEVEEVKIEVKPAKPEPQKKEKKEEKSFEQISIFDIDDE